MLTSPDNPGYDEWDIPPSGASPDASSRAAKLVWIIGIIEIAVFGCFSTVLALGAIIPTNQFKELVDQGQMSPDQFNEFIAMQPMCGPAAMVLFVLGFLPGLAYLVAGFAVRQGKAIASTITIVLVATQFIVFGVIFALNLIGAVLTHNPIALTFNALTLGSLVVLLGLAIRSLLAERQHRHNIGQKQYSDPWKHPNP